MASENPTAETDWQDSAWQYPPEYIVSLGSRPTYYAAPTIDKLQVTGETAKQVKVLGHRNRYQHKVFCLPNDNVEATWQEILRLKEALDIALYRVAVKLKEFGHYPDRLAEYETFEAAPNPLSPSVINATNPAMSAVMSMGCRGKNTPIFFMRVVRLCCVTRRKCCAIWRQATRLTALAAMRKNH